jgi:hypothetical protein
MRERDHWILAMEKENLLTPILTIKIVDIYVK